MDRLQVCRRGRELLSLSQRGLLGTLDLALTDSLIPLPNGEAHLWCCLDYESICDAEKLRSFEAFLAEEERRRLDAFALPSARHQYLITRALVRTALSRYARIAPEAWSFAEDAHGRPFVAGPPQVLDLNFNLSHTAGLIVLGVSRGCAAIGVDTEDCDRSVDLLPLAHRNFSRSEVADLERLPKSEQLRRFYAYWTLKEAYLKARGLGLSLSLDQITMELAPDEPIRARFGAELEDDPSRWSLGLFSLGERHWVALAMGAGSVAPTIRWAFGLGSPRRELRCAFPLSAG